MLDSMQTLKTHYKSDIDFARQSTIQGAPIITSHPGNKFTETINRYKLFLLRVFSTDTVAN